LLATTALHEHSREHLHAVAVVFPLCFVCVIARVIITRKHKRAEPAAATKTLAVALAGL
jgi:hypothetical protein